MNRPVIRVKNRTKKIWREMLKTTILAIRIIRGETMLLLEKNLPQKYNKLPKTKMQKTKLK